MTLQPSDVAAVVTWATAVSLVVAVVVGAAALLLVATVVAGAEALLLVAAVVAGAAALLLVVAVVLDALVGGTSERSPAPGAPDISEPHPVTDTARANLTIVGRILGKY
jgi:hypothetical protein